MIAHQEIHLLYQEMFCPIVYSNEGIASQRTLFNTCSEYDVLIF